jgi:ubiquinol-cytochrome c reductase cytochrome c1 subunit
MNRWLVVLMTTALLAPAIVAAEDSELMQFKPSGNVASLQRGARDFMSYCSGCHSLKYVRYNRMAEDLHIPEDILKKNLMFTSSKVGDTINSAMKPSNASDWFGQVPPDLTLEAEYRGADWIYTYLQSFYVDPTRPQGVDNLVFPNVAMPDVLWSLQGWQVAEKDAEGDGKHLKLASPGSMDQEQYREFVGDLTNFLAYTTAPDKKQRMTVGLCVILYLMVLTLLFYLLKKEFWRDVHGDAHHH